MRILILGDIMGRNGRDAIYRTAPLLRTALAADFLIVNGENSAHGFGITAAICRDILGAGVDVVTGGNHSFDQRDISDYLNQESRLLRPLNFPPETPGRGWVACSARNRARVLVINAMGRLYMDALDDPFALVSKLLGQYRLGNDVAAVVIDMHGEASSEKAALAYYLDGRASAIVGTHTHVPSADHRILPKGTGFATDLGMCGDYQSVIGYQAAAPVQRFCTKLPGERLQPANDTVTLSGVLLVTHDDTGLAERIEPVRLGGVLRPAWPEDAAPCTEILTILAEVGQ